MTDTSGIAPQKNHYYPFGTAFAEMYDNGTNQPYKYNGKELDQMHGLNLYDYFARHYESAIGRFTTIDPLAEKYYSWSPYVYVMNNPINVIDPLGTDTININDKGRLMSHIRSKENTVFNIIDRDGNSRSLSMEYSPISVTRGEINGQEYEAYTLFGDEKGTKAFEFLAQNLGVTKEYGGMGEIGVNIMEWSLSRFGREGSTGINVLSTGFKRNSDPSAWKIIEDNSNGLFFREHFHSHPYGGAGDSDFMPSGLPGTDYHRQGRGDIPFAEGIAKLNFRTSNSKFSVYSGYFKRYINYNKNGIVK